MTAIVDPTRKAPHRSAPPVVPAVLLAVALLLGLSTQLRAPAGVGDRPPPVAASRPVGVRTPTAVVAPTTSTTTNAPAPVPAVAPVVVATTAPPAPAPAVTTGCADALAYVATHAAPGFVATCAAHSALGHYGYTCANVPGRCDGVRIIHVACPAPFVYENEAHNSWTVIGQGSGIDPYGQGTAAEQAYCNGFR